MMYKHTPVYHPHNPQINISLVQILLPKGYCPVIVGGINQMVKQHMADVPDLP